MSIQHILRQQSHAAWSVCCMVSSETRCIAHYSQTSDALSLKHLPSLSSKRNAPYVKLHTTSHSNTSSSNCTQCVRASRAAGLLHAAQLLSRDCLYTADLLHPASCHKPSALFTYTQSCWASASCAATLGVAPAALGHGQLLMGISAQATQWVTMRAGWGG